MNLLGLAAVSFANGLIKNSIIADKFCEQASDDALASHLYSTNGNLSRTFDRIAVGPFTEEVLFREVLQSKIGLGLLPTSVLFGVVHFTTATGVPVGVFKAIDAGVGGFIYGMAYIHGGLKAAILCHALHNLASQLAFTAVVSREIGDRASLRRVAWLVKNEPPLLDRAEASGMKEPIVTTQSPGGSVTTSLRFGLAQQVMTGLARSTKETR